MKITPFRTNAINAYASQAKKVPPKPEGKTQGDSLEISPQALEINKYRSEFKNLPEVRAEKVRDIKAQIKNGTYQPSA
ncbi:flagellar biosynthesis anti-sigma factor FlgM [Peptococcaceae bacterium 1198_IL3148]